MPSVARQFKLRFSARYRSLYGFKEGHLWQNRFWDHVIRDEDDLRRHIDYIHYNPVKHGLVESPYAWQHSTFRRYVKQGLYHADWGAGHMMIFNEKIGHE